MTANPMMDPAHFIDEQLAQASPDLLRELMSTVINTLMSADADADAVCGAGYGVSSPDRVASRNGYRHRDFVPQTSSGRYPHPASGPSTRPSPSCARAPTSPTGSWSGAGALSGP